MALSMISPAATASRRVAERSGLSSSGSGLRAATPANFFAIMVVPRSEIEDSAAPPSTLAVIRFRPAANMPAQRLFTGVSSVPRIEPQTVSSRLIAPAARSCALRPFPAASLATACFSHSIVPEGLGPSTSIAAMSRAIMVDVPHHGAEDVAAAAIELLVFQPRVGVAEHQEAVFGLLVCQHAAAEGHAGRLAGRSIRPW